MQQGVPSSALHGVSQADGDSDTTTHTDTHSHGQSAGVRLSGQVSVGLNESIAGGIPVNTLYGTLASSQSASVSGSVNAEKSWKDSDADSIWRSHRQQQSISNTDTVGLSAAVGSSQTVAHSVGQNVTQAHTIVLAGVTTTTTTGYSVACSLACQSDTPARHSIPMEVSKEFVTTLPGQTAI